MLDEQTVDDGWPARVCVFGMVMVPYETSRRAVGLWLRRTAPALAVGLGRHELGLGWAGPGHGGEEPVTARWAIAGHVKPQAAVIGQA